MILKKSSGDNQEEGMKESKLCQLYTLMFNYWNKIIYCSGTGNDLLDHSLETIKKSKQLLKSFFISTF